MSIGVFGFHSYLSGFHRIGELRGAVNRVEGLMISAHSFRNIFNAPPYKTNLLFERSIEFSPTPVEAAEHPIFNLVDDLEVANGSNTDRENVYTLEVARHLGFRGTGGSDVHSAHGLGTCVTVFDADIRSEADLIEALKAGAVIPAQGLNVGRLRSIGFPS